VGWHSVAPAMCDVFTGEHRVDDTAKSTRCVDAQEARSGGRTGDDSPNEGHADEHADKLHIGADQRGYIETKK
jgi:hypothetical protein